MLRVLGRGEGSQQVLVAPDPGTVLRRCRRRSRSTGRPRGRPGSPPTAGRPGRWPPGGPPPRRPTGRPVPDRAPPAPAASPALRPSAGFRLRNQVRDDARQLRRVAGRGLLEQVEASQPSSMPSTASSGEGSTPASARRLTASSASVTPSSIRSAFAGTPAASSSARNHLVWVGSSRPPPSAGAVGASTSPCG